MKLSIIIVSWNVKEDLVNCLISIKENRPCAEFEIIVVDNASSDGTVDCIWRDFPEVIVIANKENRGFAAANNQGIERSKGEYLFFLNPDTIAHPQSLDNLIKVMDENPDVCASGPKLLNADGTIYHSVKRIITFRGVLYKKTVFGSLGIFRGHYKKLKPNNFNYDKQADVDRLSGAALMIRRFLIRQVGNMDEGFFMYYEDIDLCLRLRKAGLRIIYTPESTITHIGGRSSTQVSAKKDFIFHKSLMIYLRKHKGRMATAFFAVIFKPAVIIRQITNIFSFFIDYCLSALSRNRKKHLKSLVKLKISLIFLARYSVQFLFKT